jgi:predicted nucleic acid-binding protein
VFVDTATLYPISLADLVLRLAELGMFELVWSDHLLAEVERVLVEYKGLPIDRARYFCDCIRDAFPSGRVPPDQYLPLVDSRTGPDADDHVHSAAAIAGQANVILSADKRGYPPDDTAPARRRDPDAYLTELLKRFPDDVLRVVEEMGSSLRAPLSRRDVLQRLDKAGLTRFASAATTIVRLATAEPDGA